MSTTLQYIVVGLLVVIAAAYVLWRLGPARMRRRLGSREDTVGDSCSSCSSAPLPPSDDRK